MTADPSKPFDLSAMPTDAPYLWAFIAGLCVFFIVGLIVSFSVVNRTDPTTFSRGITGIIVTLAIVFVAVPGYLHFVSAPIDASNKQAIADWAHERYGVDVPLDAIENIETRTHGDYSSGLHPLSIGFSTKNGTLIRGEVAGSKLVLVRADSGELPVVKDAKEHSR